MGKKEMGMVETLGANIEKFAGKAARIKIMESADRMNEDSGPAEVAMWLKAGMERLDKYVAAAKKIRIREACGTACAEMNKSLISRAEAKRKKFKNLDALLENEVKKPLTGTRLVRDGKMLIWYYRPRSFSPPRRCFCGFMSGLPAEETVSATYCLCSQGFAKKYWESVLGRPVDVELLESCLTGTQECKFVIHL
jgi:hypothetical protein